MSPVQTKPPVDVKAPLAAARKTLFSRFIHMLKLVIDQTNRDRLMNLSAEIAFYELFAAFPLLLFCFALLGYMPESLVIQVINAGMEILFVSAPEETVDMIADWLNNIRNTSVVTIASIGALAALWVGSSAVGSYMDAFHFINRHRRTLPWWKKYILQVLFTALGAVGLIAVLMLWVVGPPFMEVMFQRYQSEAAWQWLWVLLRVPLAFAAVIFGLIVFYHFLSQSGRPFGAHWPGAMFTTFFFWFSSALFAMYVRWITHFDVTFGSLGTIIIFLMWLQALNLSVLMGEAWNVQRYAAKTGIGA